MSTSDDSVATPYTGTPESSSRNARATEPATTAASSPDALTTAVRYADVNWVSGVYIEGRTGAVRSSERTSPTTPITVHHRPRAAFPILTCAPSGFASPQIVFAVDCETRMTR